MRGYDPDHPLSQTSPAVRLKDEHVGEVGEGGVVGYHPREADLLIPRVHAEDERVLDRTAHDLLRDARGPVRVLQELVNELYVQALLVGAYKVPGLRPATRSTGRSRRARAYRQRSG